MGRRSLKAERREQILEAFEACVAEHGLEGTTLERVAEYAGLGRPAIRHNVGNREALIDAALDRIILRHEAAYADITKALPRTQRVQALSQYLFTGGFTGEPDAEDALLDELFALRHRDPLIAKRLDLMYRRFQRTIARELERETEASRSECNRVAYLIMVLAYGHSTFCGLGPGKRRGTVCREHALALVAEL